MIGGWIGHLAGFWPLHIMLLALILALVAAGRALVLALAGIELAMVAVWAGYFFGNYGSGGVGGFFSGQIGQFAMIAAGLIVAVTLGGLALRRLWRRA